MAKSCLLHDVDSDRYFHDILFHQIWIFGNTSSPFEYTNSGIAWSADYSKNAVLYECYSLLELSQVHLVAIFSLQFNLGFLQRQVLCINLYFRVFLLLVLHSILVLSVQSLADIFGSVFPSMMFWAVALIPGRYLESSKYIFLRYETCNLP